MLRGFQDVGTFHIDPMLVSALGSLLFVATIILLLKHISIAKSVGRVNSYKINPTQELVVIGITNTIGMLFRAYSTMGSFSCSTLKSKSGMCTPVAGLPTSVVVIVALYGLTPTFFWIPNAALSRLIIHTIADLVTSPMQSFSFWHISILEFFIFIAAVVVTIFTTIKISIYTSISVSILLLLVRIARPRGTFLRCPGVCPHHTQSSVLTAPHTLSVHASPCFPTTPHLCTRISPWTTILESFK